jgi:WD40 repeat protein
LFSLPSGKKLPIACSFDRTGDLVFSADGRLVAWSTLQGVTLVELATQRVVHLGAPLPGLTCNLAAVLAFSPDGRYLASAPRPASWPARGQQDHFVRLWEVCTGKEAARVAIPAYDANAATVACLAVAPNNRTIAVGFIGKSSFLLADLIGNVCTEISGHQEPVVALAFHPNGKILVSGSEDTTALVWDLTCIRADSWK